jgi:hypothetical protein
LGAIAQKMQSALPVSAAALHLAVIGRASAWSRAMMAIASIPEGVAAATVARSTFFVRLAREWNIHRLPHVSLALVQELAPRN